MYQFRACFYFLISQISQLHPFVRVPTRQRSLKPLFSVDGKMLLPMTEVVPPYTDKLHQSMIAPSSSSSSANGDRGTPDGIRCGYAVSFCFGASSLHLSLLTSLAMICRLSLVRFQCGSEKNNILNTDRGDYHRCRIELVLHVHWKVFF